MLRLKVAIDECKISQQTIVDLTGWSKTQISITLNTGKLPAAADKFRDDIIRFITTQPKLCDWCGSHGIAPAALLQIVADDPDSGNENGEIPGVGPEWACEDYGKPGHNYYSCRICSRRYEGYLNRAHGRAAVLDLPAPTGGAA